MTKGEIYNRLSAIDDAWDYDKLLHFVVESETKIVEYLKTTFEWEDILQHSFKDGTILGDDNTYRGLTQLKIQAYDDEQEVLSFLRYTHDIYIEYMEHDACFDVDETIIGMMENYTESEAWSQINSNTMTITEIRKRINRTNKMTKILSR